MGIAKADVIGHSLGSLTAQLLAAQHPEKVDGLVLISSTTGIGGGPGSWLWDNIMPLTAPIDPNGQFMKDWYTNPNPVDEDFITRERAESAAVPIHVWRGVLWATVIDDLTLVAPLVKSPVLVLWGEKDGFFDLTHQEKLEKAYPDAEFQVFREAGHNMFWEFPDKAAKVINDFLDAPDNPEGSILASITGGDCAPRDVYSLPRKGTARLSLRLWQKATCRPALALPAFPRTNGGPKPAVQ